MEVRPKYRKLKAGDQEAINKAFTEISKKKALLTKANFMHLISLGGDPLHDKNNIIYYIKNADPFYLQYVLANCDVDVKSRYRGGHLLDISIKHNPINFMVLYSYGAAISKNIFTDYITWSRYNANPEIYRILIADNRVNTKIRPDLLDIIIRRTQYEFFEFSDIGIAIISDIIYRAAKTGVTLRHFGFKSFVEFIDSPVPLQLCKRLIFLGLDYSFIRPLYQETTASNPILDFLDYYESGFNPMDFHLYSQSFQQLVSTFLICNNHGPNLEYLPRELAYQIISYLR